jgi:hypothetical protein
MARRRVRLSSKWPTFAETARVFKLSAATQRRISRQVDEFLEKRKDLLAAANGRRARALRAYFAVSRPETVRPGDPDYELVRRRRRQPTHAVPVREVKARLARLK